MLVDFVVPYVDNQDKVWRKAYLDYVNKRNLFARVENISGLRYKDIGLIKYQLKLVEKFMPFINKIYLLVSNIEQVPSDINKDKVVVVLHKDFIPREYLPTFNSTTIEMFLWNIPNLSEHFIYANDDMIPTKEMAITDFFENDKIKINFLNGTLKRVDSNFFYQCVNSCHHIQDRLHKQYNELDFYKPMHSFTPMIKSHCLEAYKSIEDLIKPHIWAFRTYKQHNQYIYPIYENEKYGTLPSSVDFVYTECASEEDFTHQIICINQVKGNDNAKLIINELDKLVAK